MASGDSGSFSRVFRRLTAPTGPYYTANDEVWPFTGYGWLNGDPSSPSSQAPVDTNGATLHNSGTFLICYNEGSSTPTANRPHAALATNIDILDEVVHKPLALRRASRCVQAELNGTVILTSGTIWTGDGSGEDSLGELLLFVDANGWEPVHENAGVLSRIYCTGVLQNALSVANNGFIKATVASPVTLTFNYPLPTGDDWFLYYSEKGCLASVPTGAFAHTPAPILHTAAAQNAIGIVKNEAAANLTAARTALEASITAVATAVETECGFLDRTNTWKQSNVWQKPQTQDITLPIDVDLWALVGTSTYLQPSVGDGCGDTYRVYRNETDLLITKNASRQLVSVGRYRWVADEGKAACSYRLLDGEYVVQRGAHDAGGTSWSMWMDEDARHVYATSVTNENISPAQSLPFAQYYDVAEWPLGGLLDHAKYMYQVCVEGRVEAVVSSIGAPITLHILLEYYNGTDWTVMTEQRQSTAIVGAVGVSACGTVNLAAVPNAASLSLRMRVMYTGTACGIALSGHQTMNATMHRWRKGITDSEGVTSA